MLVGVIYDYIRTCCLLATCLVSNHMCVCVCVFVCVVFRETQVHQDPQGRVVLLDCKGSEGAEGHLVQW